MLNRILPILAIALGVAGLVAVLVVLFAGRRAAAASRTGPRWKRKLLLAGLSLLGACAVLTTHGLGTHVRRSGGGWVGLKQAVQKWFMPTPPPKPAPPRRPQPMCYYKIPLPPISARPAASAERRALLARFAKDGTLRPDVAVAVRDAMENRS